MRRRILGSMLAVATVAVVLFAIPLAVAVRGVYREREMTRLEREADRAIAALPRGALDSGQPIDVGRSPDRISVAVYSDHANLAGGTGPARGGRDVTRALNGQSSESSGGSRLVVTVPVAFHQTIVGAVTASESTNVVRDRAAVTWFVMLIVALLALTVVYLIARRQARRLARPIGDIEQAAVRLGDGDFTVRVDTDQLPELARAANALNRTATQLDQLVGRERSFSADVSHQLATPLTSLRLELEGALAAPGSDLTAAIERALGEVERMQRTVTTLLAVARDTAPPAERCNVASVCVPVAERHRSALAGARRALRVDIPASLPLVQCSGSVLAEIIEVLVDNAERHGAGEVVVRAHTRGTGVVIEVEDAGSGIAPDVVEHMFERRAPGARGTGIGLALARSLAEAHGGRLRLSRARPHPVFAVTLLAAPAAPAAPAVPVLAVSEDA